MHPRMPIFITQKGLLSPPPPFLYYQRNFFSNYDKSVNLGKTVKYACKITRKIQSIPGHGQLLYIIIHAIIVLKKLV